MTADLDIHPASPDEVVAAHTNVHELWSKGLPLEEHIRARLESPSHSRATWFVGTIDGRVVTSLGSYPVAFRLHGKTLPGIAIGGVYTLSDFRGRGFAPRLLTGAEEHARGQGAALSVLYSDIGVDYYARLGYVACPSLQGWFEPKSVPAGPGRLTPIDPLEHLPQLKQLYAAYHGVLPLSIARDDGYWASILKNATNRFYALETPAGPWQGYVRLRSAGNDWTINDFALANQTDALADAFFAALAELARQNGVERVGGWMCSCNTTRNLMQLEPRTREITMIKMLNYTGLFDARLISGTSWFQAIDHV